MTPSLEGWPTKTKEASSSQEVRLTLLDNNQVFQCLGENLKLLLMTEINIFVYKLFVIKCFRF